MERFDAIVVGAGAAGMFCAAQAGQLGCRVLLLDNGKKPGRKILMSGGGRCNFTNMYVEPAAYLSQNPHFCKSALNGEGPVLPELKDIQTVSRAIAFAVGKVAQPDPHPFRGAACRDDCAAGAGAGSGLRQRA